MVSEEEFHMTNSCENQHLITDFDELDSIICESLLSPRSSCESTSAQSSQQRKRKADCPSTTDFETSSDVEVSTDPNETSSSTDVEVPTDPKETGDSQRKIRYNKKKSALKKIERMLAVPNLIWSAGNTADESSIANIGNLNYFLSI